MADRCPRCQQADPCRCVPARESSPTVARWQRRRRRAQQGMRLVSWMPLSPMGPAAEDSGPSYAMGRRNYKLSSSFANQVRRIPVDTDVLSDLVTGVEIGDPLDDPGLRIGPWILDGEFDFQVAQIGATQAFSDVQHFRVRVTDVVKPRLVIEAHRVDDQRIPIPMADRVSHPVRIRIL